ncbi:dihydrofolate reductase [Serratia phage vB_SmaS-Totoro]|nr:dihydrofolate reductase [Serratia phage vB_SmaS-Totoro]
MIVSMIVAMDKNMLVGKDDTLPWNEPIDMQWFRRKTRHKAIIMGYRTYMGIGKPLPGRLNIVMASGSPEVPGATVVPDLYDATQVAKQHRYNELVICGGPSLYNRYILSVDKLYLTVLENEYEGNVHLKNDIIAELMRIDSKETLTESGFVLEDIRTVEGVGQFKIFTRVRSAS